jgi:hypothetical protein
MSETRDCGAAVQSLGVVNGGGSDLSICANNWLAARRAQETRVNHAAVPANGGFSMRRSCAGVAPRGWFNVVACLWVWCVCLEGCTSVAALRKYEKDAVYRYLWPYGFDQYHGVQHAYMGNYWQDASGRTAYFTDLSGEQTWLVSADDERPLLIPGLRLGRCQWIDGHGVVHELPSIAFPYEATPAGVRTEVDQQTGWFFQHVYATNTVYVGNFTRDDGWVFTFGCPEEFRPEQICAIGQTVYVLDHQDRYYYAFLHWSRNCWAFAPDPTVPHMYTKVEEFRLPALVEAVDPSGPRFLCSGYGTMPIPGSRFVFDVERKRTVRQIGWDPVALFLPDDWLEGRLKGEGR